MNNTKDLFMLCGSITEAEARELNGYYIAETKFDGERIGAIKKGNEVILLNRRGRICNTNFREVVEALKAIEGEFIIDGEVISLDDDFTKLQRRALTKDIIKIQKLEKEIAVKYMIFDILSINNVDIRHNPLCERLKKLKEVFEGKENAFIEMSKGGEINIMLQKAKDEDREGIIIKDLSASYESGKRRDSWLKCKRWLETELKLIKYSENPAGIRGENEKGISVQIAGEQHKEVKDQIDKLGYADVYVQYLEETPDGMLRFPSFRSLKKDENKDKGVVTIGY